MGSNLKQEAMERVGEVEHAECYYDTDRNKPLPGRAAAPVVGSVVPSRQQLMYAALDCGHMIEAAQITLYCDEEKGGNALSQLCDRLVAVCNFSATAAPQPVDAAQAVPGLSGQSLKVIERALIGLRDGWLERKDADAALLVLCGAAPSPSAQPAAQAVPDDDRDALIACLGDDAAKLADANPDDEMAQTMREAAAMLDADGVALALFGMGISPVEQPTDTTKEA